MDNSIKLIIADWDGSQNAVNAILQRISQEIGGYGVEVVRGDKENSSSYWIDVVLVYVNVGDSYSPTVIYDTDKGEFVFSSVGDVIESDPRIQEVY